MKRILYACIVFFVCACAFVLGLNHVPKEAAVYSQAVTPTDPFEAYRESRAEVRADEVAQLRGIIYSPETEADIAALARAQLVSCTGRTCMETAIEGRLQLQGFDGVVSVNAGQAYVYVRAELLTLAQSSIISEIVCSETGFSNDNVKIIPMNYGNF